MTAVMSRETMNNGSRQAFAHNSYRDLPMYFKYRDVAHLSAGPAHKISTFIMLTFLAYIFQKFKRSVFSML